MAKNVQRVNELQAEGDVIFSRDKIQLDHAPTFDNPLDLITKQYAEALMAGAGLPNTPAGTVTDWNVIPSEGLMHGAADAPNGPFATDYFTGWSSRSNKDSNSGAILGHNDLGDWFSRTQIAGVWGNWSKLWNSWNSNLPTADWQARSLITNTTTGQAAHRLHNQNSQNRWTVSMELAEAAVNIGSDYTITAVGDNNSSILPSYFKIKRNNGFVGIGVEPTERLQVNGNIRTSSSFISSFPLALKMYGGIGIIGTYDMAGAVRYGFIQIDQDRVILQHENGQRVIQLGLLDNVKVGVRTAGPEEALHVYSGNALVDGAIISRSWNDDNRIFMSATATKAFLAASNGDDTAPKDLVLNPFGGGVYIGNNFTVWHSGNLDPATVGGNFVTLDTAQYITGLKSFANQTADNVIEFQVSEPTANLQGLNYARTIVKNILLQGYGGNVGIGVSPIGKFQVKTGPDLDFAVLNTADGVVLVSIDDLGTVNKSMRFDATVFNFNIGNINSNAMIRSNKPTVFDNALFDQANFVAAPVDGSYPAYGFHRSGVSGLALYHVSGADLLRIRTSLGGDYTVWHSGNLNPVTKLTNIADWNANFSNEFLYGINTAANNPDPNFYVTGIALSINSQNNQVIAASQNGKLYFRSQQQGGWGAWNTVFHSGGTVQIGANGAVSDPYGPIAVTNPSDQNYSYYGFTRAGNYGGAMGLSTSNEFIMGPSGSGTGVITANWVKISNAGVTAAEFYRTSSRKEKRNIKPLKDSALDILLNTKIKTYNKKSDNALGIGFIAEETHSWLSGEEKKSHNFGNHLALLTKAIQELKEEIDKLKN